MNAIKKTVLKQPKMNLPKQNRFTDLYALFPILL